MELPLSNLAVLLRLHECPRFGGIVYVAVVPPSILDSVLRTVCGVWTLEKLEIWGKRGGETRGGWTNQIAFDETEHVGRMDCIHEWNTVQV